MKELGGKTIRNRTTLVGSEKGATAVEYALVIAVVLVVVIGAATFMSDPLRDFFQAAVQQIQNWMGTQPDTGAFAA